MKKSPLRPGRPPQRHTRLKARSITKQPPSGRDDEYRAYVRSAACLVWQHKGNAAGCCWYLASCRVWVEAAHVQPWGSSRVDHGNLVPLCPKHHDEQEGKTVEFEARYGLDLKAEAARLAAQWEAEHGA